MGELTKDNILSNIATIKERISKASQQAGRTDSVRLLLATKQVPAEIIRWVIENGNTLVGENKVQEFTKKHGELNDLVYEKHFIGNLQTNKVNEALRTVTCIQTVDRISLAEKLNQRLTLENRMLDIMVQVNTSGEGSKSGVNPDEAVVLVKEITAYKALNIVGFMTIGLNAETVEEARPSYKTLSDISKEVLNKGILNRNKLELSMGMSGDLEVAIQEGATIVRVGSSIFGERKY